MKKYLTIVMLSILLAPFVARMFYTTFFYFNQSSIARELCINRAAANNTCQGKCYLKKQLDKLNTPSSESAPKSNSTEKVEEKVFFTGAASFLLVSPIAISLSQQYSDLAVPSIPTCAQGEIFHPPLV
jgi:hypothetical protein